MKLARPVIVPMPLPGDLAVMLVETSPDFEVVDFMLGESFPDVEDLKLKEVVDR